MGIRVSFLSVLAASACLLVASGCGGGNGALPLLTGTPSITGVTPTSVAPGGTVTISGLNLNGVDTTAYFNGVASAASGGSQTSVTVSVPATLAAGPCSVYVVTNDGQGDFSTQSNSFQITLS